MSSTGGQDLVRSQLQIQIFLHQELKWKFRIKKEKVKKDNDMATAVGCKIVLITEKQQWGNQKTDEVNLNLRSSPHKESKQPVSEYLYLNSPTIYSTQVIVWAS